jgi:2-methylfumaryl-CoA isomerase
MPLPAPLTGLRVVEVSSFVAAPTAGLTLRQLGAEVIRIDPVGGAADTKRWPLSADGHSIYWAGLNRGKASVELDLSSPEGQELLRELVCAPGAGNGIVVSNIFGRSWLSDEQLRASRPDLIHVQVLGRADGSPAVDYVVNAATGLPYATGPEDATAPVNHVLPAWDLLCGMHAATAVLAAVHRRDRDGTGTHATVSLEDVATSTLTTLGLLSEAHQTGASRPRLGNAVYGTFGTDATLADGTVVMVTTVTARQWRTLLEVTGCTEAVDGLAAVTGADFGDEGDRYRHREAVVALLRPWFAARTLPEVAAALDGTQVLWSPFRQLTDLAGDVAAGRSAVATVVDEAGLGSNVVTTGPLRLRGEDPPAPAPAPVLGADTDAVLIATTSGGRP